MPVVHAEFEQANARWEALCKRKFCMDCRIKSGNDEWNERKRFGGETPTDAIDIQPRLTGPAAPPSGGAHLSAFHRGSGLGDRTPPPSFSSALPGMRPPSGFPLSLPVSVQRCFSRTGRNAGRADFPKLPGSGLQGRARAPHSPRAYGLPAAARPNHRARFSSICNEIGDDSQRCGDTKFCHPEVRAAEAAIAQLVLRAAWCVVSHAGVTQSLCRRARPRPAVL
jgi:hypothetical protein